MRYRNRFFVFLTLATLLWAGFSPQSSFAADQRRTKILFVEGPCNHPKGTHEAAAGARLLSYLAGSSEVLGKAECLVVDKWPEDDHLLETIATVVFIGDLFPPERMEDPVAVKRSLGLLMDRGVGIVCLHFATGIRGDFVAEDGDHPLLDWLGGYYAARCPHHKSEAKICTSTIEPETGSHPVLHGWSSFTFDDEPYWNIYFGKEGPGQRVTPLASSMLPPELPQKETVAWAFSREDGGRGVGIVLPHYYRSWLIRDLRTLVLNSIAWTAKLEIPQGGIESPDPDLAAFEPASVHPEAAAQ